MTGRLLGRDAELTAVLARLRARRLVTLTGPGGIGKTALAAAAADELAPEFTYGSVAIDLTRVDRPEGVAEAIAGQLGYADFGSLLDSPSDQPALVVVDNCEHVLDAAADAIDAMLTACRMPTVLATSRAPLDLPDESIHPVGPLAVPLDGGVDMSGAAMELLLERVTDHGVDPDTLDATELAELCRRLDGVPLALELAAARLRSASLAELLADLDARPHALARRRFRGQAHHRGVAEMVGWSTDLLDDAGRSAFARLGVFSGPFSATMAATLVSDVAGSRDVLDELVDVSLVAVDTSGEQAWYRMLHPIRAVAVEQLRASGELEAVESRFVDQVVTAAVDVIARTTDTWDAGAIPDLMAMYDNIAASIRWLIEHDDEPDRALVLVAVLWGLVHQTHTAEISQLGEAVLDRWAAPDAVFWADAVATVATCRTLTGRYDEAVDLATATLALAERSSFAPTTLRRVLAQTYRILGDVDGSIATFEQGAMAARRAGVMGFALELSVDVGIVLAEAGRSGAGLRHLDATLAEAEAEGDRVNAAWARAGRAHVLIDVDPVAAEAEASAALADSREIDYPAGRSTSLRSLARARLRRGDLPSASESILALLDELLARGGMHDLRLATDVAAGVLRAAGDSRWADLAATTAQLPVTTVIVPIRPEAGDGAGGAILSTREAYVLMREALGELAAGGAGTASTVVPASPQAMISEGDVIRIDFEGRSIRLKRSKGLVDLARLLADPGRDVAAVDLMGAGVVSTSVEFEHLDRQARDAYERRIRELAADVERAEQDHDLGRVEQLRSELDLLVDQLTQATGLGGRSRTSAGPAEKARSAVTQRVRTSIKRIGQHDAALGRHLELTVTTGTYCRYAADGLAWQIDVD